MKNLLKYTHGAKSTILRNNSEQTLLDTYRKMASSDVAMEDNPAHQSVEVYVVAKPWAQWSHLLYYSDFLYVTTWMCTHVLVIAVIHLLHASYYIHVKASGLLLVCVCMYPRITLVLHVYLLTILCYTYSMHPFKITGYSVRGPCVHVQF